MDSAEFLDVLKKKYGIVTDLNLGQLLKVPQACIALYRTGECEFDDSTCKLVAFELGEAPEFVLAEIRAVRARRTEQEAAWRRLGRLARKGRAAVFDQ